MAIEPVRMTGLLRRKIGDAVKASSSPGRVKNQLGQILDRDRCLVRLVPAGHGQTTFEVFVAPPGSGYQGVFRNGPKKVARIVVTPGWPVEIYDVGRRMHSRLSVPDLSTRVPS